MRLLITGDTAGGVFTFISDLAEGLSCQDVDVTLATFGPPPPPRNTNYEWLHHSSKLEWQEEPWEDLAAAGDWLSHLICRKNPDILHFNTLCHGDLNAGIPLITTIHSCVASWWTCVNGDKLPPAWDRYRRTVTESLDHASQLVVPSRALLNHLRNVWPIDFSKVLVIPNGRDSQMYLPSEKQPFALSVGRFWDEAKNMRALDSAAVKSKWPIYLAGDANTSSACRTLGALPPEELADWYARAAIYVSPAKYEPFGLSVLEAAMSGCALLLSDIPSFRENWLDAAMFFQPDGLDSALSDLIEHSDLRCRLQTKALARSKSFERANMIAGYLSAYQELSRVTCVS